MPRMSKVDAPDQLTLEGYEGAFGAPGADYTVGFERYTADADLSPMFMGLPDDRCHSFVFGNASNDARECQQIGDHGPAPDGRRSGLT